jgi:hypothetical protein
LANSGKEYRACRPYAMYLLLYKGEPGVRALHLDIVPNIADKRLPRFPITIYIP